MKSSLSMRFPAFRRLRWPVLPALVPVGCLLATEFAPAPPEATAYPQLPGQVRFILAIGWTVTAIVDHLLARRLGRLQIKEKNNLAARETATRLDVLRRIWIVLGGVATVAAALTVIPFARQLGVSVIREKMIAWLQASHPEALPRVRTETDWHPASNGHGRPTVMGRDERPLSPPAG